MELFPPAGWRVLCPSTFFPTAETLPVPGVLISYGWFGESTNDAFPVTFMPDYVWRNSRLLDLQG
eukprot:10344286-Ditylum_brightwellii.AAC.1